ncbi:MAG: efflux RND transporter periplasmic adaptor subunit [Chitinophagales bacterium]|nr:efflux RND transporter periplasmic adaptor subunit [Hyphomicrobiales bacterium]
MRSNSRYCVLVFFAASVMTFPIPAKAQSASEVRTTKPQPSGGPEIIRLPVVAEPEKEARLYARVNGFVAERRVDIGDAVKEGDVLAVIDAPEIERNHERAKAAVGQATARVGLANANLKRTQALAGKDFATDAALDDRRSQAEVAIADKEAADAEVRRFDELLAFREVRAPFSGFIVERNVEVGDLVVGDTSMNATPMFRIARIDELRVVASVPQSALSAIRAGETVKVTFDKYPGEVFSAKVSRQSQLVDRASGTMRVEMALSNPGGKVPAGLAGQAEFALASAKNLRLPTSAVFNREGKPHVAVVESGAVQFRAVTLGRDLGRLVEIREGVTDKDDVVLNPNGLLRPGDPATSKAAGAS